METPIRNIQTALSNLDFNFGQSEGSAVYFIEDVETRDNIHPKVAIDLDKAKLFQADAVYFRFFDSDRLPLPQIYIYDNSIHHFDDNYYAELHRNIWSASEIPMFMVIERASIKIYDSRKPVKVKTANTIVSTPIRTISLENLSESNKALKDYNARLFDNGSFWESSEAGKHFLNNHTVYEKLISGLKAIRELFRANSGVDCSLTDQVLILSILVKYLEENGLDEDGVNLAQKFFNDEVGYSSFIDIIQNKKLPLLFDRLTDHFGDIFKLSDIQKETLNKAQLDVLVKFFEGKLEEHLQTVLWAEYSFKFIPVELISNFYEEFLPKEKLPNGKAEKKKDTGAVYTPSFLVNFLVDECLPLTTKNLDYNIKLIDVSCGSGIFLVTAFKRLVQRWRIANKENRKLANPTPEILKSILKKNIFGVDINNIASDLTTFSLNLSLCSMLTPRQIWTELRFDNLKYDGNIICEDFFQYLVRNKPNDFDLVLGNPPFKGLKKESYVQYEKLLHSTNQLLCKIPDNQLALLFLDKAMDVLKTNGLLCLIMPSGPLLYNNTLSFRKLFFEKFNIPQIIDFTLSRNNLFYEANVAVAAIFVQKQSPNEKDILHLIVNRTKASKEKSYFEIDHYDFHDVPKSIATTSEFIWKANLLGGTRVYYLIERFRDSSFQTLRQFLQLNKDNRQWDFGQGYIVGEANSKFKANYISGKPSVVDKGFNDEGITATEIQNAIDFKDISRQILFEPPHLLIKKTIGKRKIPTELRYDYLTFKNEIIGIHSPQSDVDQLIQVEKYFKDNNNLLRCLIVCSSSRSGISRSIYTSLLEDFFNLPYRQGKIDLSLSENIVIEDIVNYLFPYIGRGENAEINKICSLSFLKNYFSKIYCTALNSIYKRGNKEYRLSKVYESTAFYACEYKFLDIDIEPEYKLSEADFSALIDNWSSRNALIKRVLRIYGTDSIILVKPKQFRYWLKSVALRDADETIAEAFDII